VGTTEILRGVVEEAMAEFKCDAAYVPEFLRLGTAVDSFVNADRFVVGADSAEIAERVVELFQPLGRPIVVTGTRTAEMAKHAANAFLATSISFINEIADLCDTVGGDPIEVAAILKLDRRIGPHAFLSPGLGYAGGTLGRELRVLQRLGDERDLQTRLIDAVVAVNAERPRLVRRRLVEALGDLGQRRVALFGLTYKPGTSTLRRAISLEIAHDLRGAGVEVTAFDPLADLTEVDELPVTVAATPYEAAVGAAAIVLVTEWDGLDQLDFVRLRSTMSGDVFLDTRNLSSPAAVRDAGFRYLRI
jgi:UDPglucose 6-dehydrogenase